MIKKVLLTAILAIAISTGASAQLYNWSAGVRAAGDMSGIAGKYHIDSQSAVEAMLSVPYKDGMVVTALYEYNIPIISDKFNAYVGGGAHTGGYMNKFILGVDIVGGIEYKFPSAPFAISIDYKPALNIIGHSGFYWSSVGLGLKFAF